MSTLDDLHVYIYRDSLFEPVETDHVRLPLEGTVQGHGAQVALVRDNRRLHIRSKMHS
jgi:hypothetical protein